MGPRCRRATASCGATRPSCKRINEGIEKNRKRDAVLEVVDCRRPAAGRRRRSKSSRRGHEFLFGCNAFVLGQLDTPEKNRKYEEAFVRLFNFATVPFYWEGTEPAQGELRYAEGSRDIWRRPPADRYIAFAKKHGLTLKGHPLLWHAYNPPWLPKDAEELQEALPEAVRRDRLALRQGDQDLGRGQRVARVLEEVSAVLAGPGLRGLGVPQGGAELPAARTR